MGFYTFIMEYVDVREVKLDADSLEEAQVKMDEGGWKPDQEVTVDFYENRLVQELRKASD